MNSPVIRRSQVSGMNMHHKQYSLEYFLNSMEREGYVSVAFWGGPPHFELANSGYSDCKALRRRFANHGLSCTCFTAPALLPGNQFSIDGPEHIQRTFAYFQNGIRAAAELGAPVIIANSGYGLRQHPREEAWKRTRDLLRRVAEEGEKHGVTFTMESLRPHETNLCFTLAETKRMIEEVNHPNLAAMIDTTAMAVSEETIWDWFGALGKQIVNLHFIDANPAGHLAWGDGNLPLEDMLRCLNQYGYEGPIGLEITEARYFADPAAADRQSMRILSRYFAD